MVDADSKAVVAGALIEADPGGATVVTDASGRALFAALPAGLYRFSAVTSFLDASSQTVTPVVLEATATTDWHSIVAGSTGAIRIPLQRLSLQSFNLRSFHTLGNVRYTDANCESCHGDREGELSREPMIAPFHAMVTHASLPCTFCHANVDLEQDSGATLRKQVAVATVCRGCHPQYPTQF